MKPREWGHFGDKPRWELKFRVAYPEDYSGTILWYYLPRYDGDIPPGSHLYQAVCVANGGPMRPNQTATRSMFEHRMFRCQTRLTVPKQSGRQPYTVIDYLI